MFLEAAQRRGVLVQRMLGDLKAPELRVAREGAYIGWS